jgi:hypothetical protein
VFKTQDGGQTWTELPSFAAATSAAASTWQYRPDWLNAFAPFFDPQDPTGDTVHVTTNTHGVWKTTDGGQTWNHVLDLPFLSVHRLTFEPGTPVAHYITTYGGGAWAY